MLKQKHSIFVAQPLQGGVAVVDADGVKASEAAIGHKLRTFDELMVEVSG